jgi:hypothetical protein
MYIITKINWITVFLIVFISLFIFFSIAYYRYYTTPTITITNNITTNKLKNEIKTGDLIFIEYDSKYSTVINIFSQTKWSHVGFIYSTNNSINVIEVSYYSDSNYDGLCVIPLDKWLKLNKGRKCGIKKLKNSISINLKVIENILAKFKYIKLDLDLLNWGKTLVKRNYKQRNLIKQRYFCSEFIALLLQKLKIIDCIYTPDSYSPIDLYNLHNYYSTEYIFEI